MTDEIKMNYPLMEEMAQKFREGGEQLQDTMQAMQNLANMMEEGALLGQGGQAFVDAIRSNLAPAIARLTDKFQELQTDVLGAMRDMQEADDTTAGFYG